ncbi:pIIIa [Murine mastadenovirus A]|uniref:Pre-hexon-linking protein IIIa n=1 Tax=Murine adenovirus A serotype 1 TaxID=10530 RepID=CAP3_ADEM1|nr:pIIIa [Murine mastadenovirus A]AP_000345.1 pIIIa [Murine mastadenovirus A]O10438.1 RecName: Full=Pre-hexon-linking protein IIIa; AltName: Full=Capsid vertex-specific component IIIa; Short=CVSC; AltName: Full=Protein IIIa; AltName: Full=pIIIa; Contains: RecName: Full=Hexon-linking protein IIIa [Murine adenovirus 1]AAB53753.1 pIIIa [Murine adenovirus 1]
MAALSPTVRAALQSQAAGEEPWEQRFKRIMSTTLKNPGAFRSQPWFTRRDAILEAVLPSRTDPTHEKVLAVVNGLVQAKAVRADEGGAIYDALLQRVGRYNSSNVQSNLDHLVQDVREAVAMKAQEERGSMGSLVALNGFLSTLPSTVNHGQSDYVGFVGALRQLIAEVPQTLVYRTGPFYYFQTSRQGLQTVNLTKAFQNLSALWGVTTSAQTPMATAALLTPNTRLLLLLVAPFTDSRTVNGDTYLGHLLTLYREALRDARLDEITYSEIRDVARATGQDDSRALQSTLNFLVSQQTKRLPEDVFLTPQQTTVLRYLQKAIELQHAREPHERADRLLDAVVADLEPSFYSKHRHFITKLLDYFQRAAALNPHYFMSIVKNKHWTPPPGFYTGDFELPEVVHDSFQWDDTEDGAWSRPLAEQVNEEEPNTDYLAEYRSAFSDNREEKNQKKEWESLVDMMARWKTHRQSALDLDDEIEELSSTNPFKHLQPQF